MQYLDTIIAVNSVLFLVSHPRVSYFCNIHASVKFSRSELDSQNKLESQFSPFLIQYISIRKKNMEYKSESKSIYDITKQSYMHGCLKRE